MQGLINKQRIANSALAKINAEMRSHFSKAEKWNTSQQRNKKSMGCRMGSEPPFPVHRDITTRTFFNGHPVTLQWIVCNKMPKNQDNKEI